MYAKPQRVTRHSPCDAGSLNSTISTHDVGCEVRRNLSQSGIDSGEILVTEAALIQTVHVFDKRRRCCARFGWNTVWSNWWTTSSRKLGRFDITTIQTAEVFFLEQYIRTLLTNIFLEGSSCQSVRRRSNVGTVEIEIALRSSRVMYSYSIGVNILFHRWETRQKE